MAISADCFSVNPKASAMDPNVPVNFFAIVSDNPKVAAAFLENLSIFDVIVGNVTSTTFCTSAKSEPNSMHCFPKSIIFFVPKAAAKAAPAFVAMP